MLFKEHLCSQEIAAKDPTQALAEAIKERDDLFDFNTTIYIIIDNHNMIVNANFQAAKLLGIDRKHLINRAFFSFITLNTQAILQKNLETLVKEETKQSCDIEVLPKAGNKKYITIECILLKNQFKRLSLFDITERLQLESDVFELKKSLNLIDNLFKYARDAIAAIDNDFSIKFITPSFRDLFSVLFFSKVQVGTNISLILSAFPKIKVNIFNACQEALLGNNVSVILENPGNTNIPYFCHELTISSFCNPYTQKNEFVFHIINLTEHKLEEKKLQKKQEDVAFANKLSAMGEIATAFAHEISQPLTAIGAYSHSALLILKQTPNTETTSRKLRLTLKKITTQAEHAGKIIHNMKNFIRNDNTVLEETDINVLIKETMSIFNCMAYEFKIKIQLNLQDNLPKIMTNQTHIMQIILNLSRNSIEALQDCPKIKPELIIETTQEDDNIVVHLKDNGPGIPFDLHHKILDTHFTTKQLGTGIGLGICRTLIEAHHGKLFAQEHQNTGAWFTFTLPIFPAVQV